VQAPLPSLPPHVVGRALPADPVGFARGLFAALHALDDAGVTRLFVEAPPDDEPWLAVADRLRRAATR
jgi:L-threonylcarbamoyladenylate synthase